ncbi:putative non-specific serine/threonine protein kinase [Medicago truncatula]|uniref:Putative non-specific serine/threonine protein kinase n=1 Tax=Medicago truncatula TaxID=3880 RepID=A0A396I1J8_MEDTR|nr:putative non-specific serine/threonine protein kinase [Medicago truncatula]
MKYCVFNLAINIYVAFFVISIRTLTFFSIGFLSIEPFMAWFLLFLHLFLFHFPSFSSSSSSFNFSCHHNDSSALLQFKSSFIIGFSQCVPLLKTATWKNGTDCCSWNGVTCDTVSGHVIDLNLGCEGLTGTFNPNSTLFHLVHLQTLNLSYNDFFDSHFHYKFCGFQSLTHLDLSDSNLEGEIPTQISHLSKLQSLHLSENYDLIWKETTLKRLLQNATDLRELFLDSTDMSSIRPNSIALLLNQSLSLVTLNLHYTRLSGKLKRSLICLASIQELDMSYNDELQGQLPELSCSTSLRIIDLSGCAFEGEIPMYFSNLTHLTSLTLSNNNLNGSIPSSLLTLPRLTFLHLYSNQLSGRIPNASLPNLQHLIHLDLSKNLFSGQIPSSLFNLNQLYTLDCSKNKLEGPIPNKTTGFQELNDLRLNDNLLNGTIPSSLLSLPSLVHLVLSNNRLTRHITAISSYSLKKLDLSGNKLQGNIPKSIFNLANLTLLDLSSNNLSDVIDFQHFSKLQYLKTLSLSHNSQLSLTFEPNVNYNFSYLSKLDLSSINLTEFPISGKVPLLDSLDLSNNKLNGKVPDWLPETMNSLTFLNLSQNMFTSIDQISMKNEQL